MGCHGPEVRVQAPPSPLPTQARLKGSVFQVQKAIHCLFLDHPTEIFDMTPQQPPTFEVYWRGKKHPAGITLFKDMVNENDAYISCGGKAACKSGVYRDNEGKPLDLIEDFQVHIIPQGANESLVKVIGIDPKVELPPSPWPFLPGRAKGPVLRPVSPSTVEENRILEGIRRELGPKKRGII